jgi:hypothetical protein
MKKLIVAIFACLLANAAQANTIKLNLSSYSYDSGTNQTTFSYNVFLTQQSGLPGSVALFDVEGLTGASFTLSPVVGVGSLSVLSGGTSTLGTVTLSAPSDTTISNALGSASGLDSSRNDVRIDFGSSLTLNPAGFNLGVLNITSTVNAVSTLALRTASGDINLETNPDSDGFHLELTGGPASNGTSTTPLPTTALAGSSLLGALGVLRRRRKS